MKSNKPKFLHATLVQYAVLNRLNNNTCNYRSNLRKLFSKIFFEDQFSFSFGTRIKNLNLSFHYYYCCCNNYSIILITIYCFAFGSFCGSSSLNSAMSSELSALQRVVYGLLSAGCGALIALLEGLVTYYYNDKLKVSLLFLSLSSFMTGALSVFTAIMVGS